MKFRVKSISVKMSMLYLFLAMMNMSIFTIMIYENQIDLITENSKYHIKQRIEDFVATLHMLTAETGDKKIFRLTGRDEVLREVSEIIRNKLTGNDSLLIFTEEGTVLHRSRPGLAITSQDISNGITAVANLEYSGRRIYSTVDERSYVISFYIPATLHLVGDTIMLFKIEMREFRQRLWELYRMIAVILVVLAVFHLAVALLFQRMFVRPIQSLHEKSVEIRRGDLGARADVNRDDEIGELAAAFNSMADSIQEKIITLQRHHDQMEEEMDVASSVQQLIYPKVQNDSRFSYAIFHKSLTKVSGDYYDMMRLDGSRTGYILVDVSGHGMPAALVTMLIKEIFTQAAPLYDNPADLFRYMNRESIELLTREGIHMGVYFTAIYIMISDENVLSFCNAGHEQGFVLKRSPEKLLPLPATGGPLGISATMDGLYNTARLRLAHGDKIVLFTDGIIEARNPGGAEFGISGLDGAIRKHFNLAAEQMLKGIAGDLDAYVGPTGLMDDATIIVIEVT